MMMNNPRQSQVVEEQMRIHKELQREIDELETKKRKLFKEIQNAELQVTYIPLDNKNDVLSAFKLYGFHLSKFSFKETDDKLKVYDAVCDQGSHSFRLSVTSNQQEQISSVQIAIPEDSALLEIEDILCDLSGELCPHLLLITVEQVVHLTEFRSEILQLITSTARNFFQITAPLYLKHRQQVCTIIARKRQSVDISVEIQWTFRWDSIQQTLVHSFAYQAKQAKSLQVFKDKVQKLQEQPFTIEKGPALKAWWQEFIKFTTSL